MSSNPDDLPASLPDDIVLCIFRFCSLDTLRSCYLASKHWSFLLTHHANAAWKRICVERWKYWKRGMPKLIDGRLVVVDEDAEGGLGDDLRTFDSFWDVFLWRDATDRQVLKILTDIGTAQGPAMRLKVEISTLGKDAIDVLDRTLKSPGPTDVRRSFAARDIRSHLQRKMIIDQWRAFGGGMPPQERGKVPIEEMTYLFSLFGDSALDPDFVKVLLDNLADGVRSFVLPELSNLEKATVICNYLFLSNRFSGNVENYYHIDNSLIDRVLATGKGIPISLCVVFKAVAARCGLNVDIIAFPGHMLSRITDLTQPPPNHHIYIDVFHGVKMLTASDLRESLAANMNVTDDTLIQPASPIDILMRMCRNILGAAQRVDTHESDTLSYGALWAMLSLDISQAHRRLRAMLYRYLLSEKFSIDMGLALELEDAIERWKSESGVGNLPMFSSLRVALAEFMNERVALDVEA
ncbi:hypothetical protein M427DRAFT_59231 [Gonapodya prolifera JEL478]|uniref:Protein SirB1 N-terminal domain-containing protein n=1 Tax=Gonapodya prolifera (strain JEL478) TaxID=1344416 RepID=A0A139A7D3_GONPJ|nr:hypothetical protein M427DRAFT_59231 [Gonapodya prolifera JEL478]|eukprot:KXS12702.1 hypothetical protein M427DRAFT_59231 [Gonapodya prolifera JEL478]